MKELEVLPGDSIIRLFEVALRLSDDEKQVVMFSANSRTVMVFPDEHGQGFASRIELVTYNQRLQKERAWAKKEGP